jgi:hypothetical protein
MNANQSKQVTTKIKRVLGFAAFIAVLGFVWCSAYKHEWAQILTGFVVLSIFVLWPAGYILYRVIRWLIRRPMGNNFSASAARRRVAVACLVGGIVCTALVVHDYTWGHLTDSTCTWFICALGAFTYAVNVLTELPRDRSGQ